MVFSGSGGFIDRFPQHGSDYSVDALPVCVREVIAGGAAGAIAKTAVAPLERIKILLQTRSQGYHSLGIYQSFKKILKYEGARGLYKGNCATVIRVFPYSGLHYMTYEEYRCWILNNCPSFGTGPAVDLLAGSAAGGTAVLCTYPLDLARTKLAYQVRVATHSLKATPNGPLPGRLRDVFQNVYKEGGIRAFYRGVGPTIVGILPYAGLKYYVYEALKRQFPSHQDSIILRLSCGAIAGLLGQTVTYPLDVVRRQMQVENIIKGNTKYKSTRKALMTIIRDQGCRQLYAGLSINYLKFVPSVAIGFTTYDVMKSWLHYSSQQT